MINILTHLITSFLRFLWLLFRFMLSLHYCQLYWLSQLHLIAFVWWLKIAIASWHVCCCLYSVAFHLRDVASSSHPIHKCHSSSSKLIKWSFCFGRLLQSRRFALHSHVRFICRQYVTSFDVWALSARLISGRLLTFISACILHGWYLHRWWFYSSSIITIGLFQSSHHHHAKASYIYAVMKRWVFHRT